MVDAARPPGGNGWRRIVRRHVHPLVVENLHRFGLQSAVHVAGEDRERAVVANQHTIELVHLRDAISEIAARVEMRTRELQERTVPVHPDSDRERLARFTIGPTGKWINLQVTYGP